MTTITSSTTIGITLSSPSYVNPIVINSGVTIANLLAAVFASSGFWTIQNGGTISSQDNYGIALRAGGSVTNAVPAAIAGGQYGVNIAHDAGAVVNSGTIVGTVKDGIALLAGGSVTNAASAAIAGGRDGIQIAASAGTVVNSGRIAGTNVYGVLLHAGGAVTNAASASISGGGQDGVQIQGGAGTVVNSGGIAGTRFGIYLSDGGIVTNAASASIAGGRDGIQIAANAGTVVNSGSIAGSKYGVVLAAGGTVTNAASASIAGYVGVDLQSGGTVTNAGTITGSHGKAVTFHGNAGNRLVVDPGAVFSGTANGQASASNVLELASGGTGTLTGLGTSFTNFGTVTVDSGASWELAGAATIAAGATLTDSGMLTVGGTLENAGTISGAITVGGGGVLTNGSGGTITSALTAVYGAAGATVVNSGSIAGKYGFALVLASGAVTNAASAEITGGVYLKGSGVVTNAASASLVADRSLWGVYVGGGGTVVNSGSIAEYTLPVGHSRGMGVELRDGGTVTNAVSASIASLYAAVYITNGAGTVVNSGTISCSEPRVLFGQYGVELLGGGSVTNAAPGSIDGYAGILLYGGGTVTNAGTITGTSGRAISFGGNVPNLLVVDPGAVFNGAVSGSTNAGNALELASGSSTGTLTGLGTSFTNFGTVTVDGGASWQLTGANTIDGTLTDNGTLTNAGTISGAVTVGSGGILANASGGTITAGNDAVVRDAGGPATVINSGSITGTGEDGILLLSGGLVTNAVSASITGANYGVVMGGSAGTVINSGTIAGNIDAVELASGSVTNAAFAEMTGGVEVGSGAVTNAASARINSHILYGVYVNSAGTVVNSGTIADDAPLMGFGQGAGVVLGFGGAVTNAVSASILGTYAGIYIKNAAGTVVNYGNIFGSATAGSHGKYGVEVLSGGSVTNAAPGSIAGMSVGILLSKGGTVTNAGTIAGSGGTAVSFRGTASNLLVVDPGAVFDGAARGSTSATNALELASGGGIGTLTGLGTSFANFGTVMIDPGAAWELTGSGTVAAGGTLTNDGTLTLSGGTMSDTGSLVNNGGIVIAAGALSVVNLAGSGSVTISSQGTLDVLSGVVGNVTVSSGGALVVSSGATASSPTVEGDGTIEVLNGGTLAGGTIDDGTVDFDITDSASFGGTLSGSGTLAVSGGGDLDVASAYTGSALIDDSSTLEFTSTDVGAITFSGTSTGFGGRLKFDAGSIGPIAVVNSNDTVIAQPGNSSWIDAAVSYTLPANIDTLFLFVGAQGAGNSDAAGDALYALDTVNAQTLTGNSANDTFVVYNSSDVVVPKAGSHDTVYAAASYTLPTGVDVLFLEGNAAQGTGNSDAAGDALYAANPGQVATLTGNSANDAFVVYNSADVVVPKAGSHDLVYSAVSYTLPTGVDVLLLEAGTQGVGNSDASGDALYAADAGIAQTVIGNSANDTFVVYNSADVVTPKAGSHDVVYSAVNYTLPTGVDTLILEAGTQGTGNSDAAGDVLYAADAGIAQTLTGHSRNDTFAVYNSADVLIAQAGSTDTVYAAANFTLPTNADTLFLEGNASHGTGNNDAVDALFGNSGVASTLVAGSGADTLYVTGTAGTLMTGGAGHDTFAFPNVMGHDEVTNFGTPKDTLQFNTTLFSNFTAAMNAASQAGANTVFTIDANDTVTLDNVTKTSLTAGNFHFV